MTVLVHTKNQRNNYPNIMKLEILLHWPNVCFNWVSTCC